MPIIGQLGNNTNPNFQPANCVTLQANAPSANAVGNKVGTLYFTKAGAAYLATKNTGLSGTVTWTLITSSTGAASAASYTATAGDFTATNGNLVLNTIGNGIQIKTGTNARIGQATLSGGTITVANTSVTANSRIFLTRNAVNASTALGILTVGTITANTSFVIYAATAGTPGTPLAADVSTVNWLIVESIP